MKLYYSPGACSMAPHIVLREIGKKFDLEQVDLGTKKTAAGKDYTKINPKGYVPTLELNNGDVLTEVSTIVQYLADKAKATKILPKPGTMARYRAMEMLNFISSELHKSFGPLFNKDFPEAARTMNIERIGKRLDFLDKLLAKNKFLLGKSFSVADSYAFTVLGWGKYVGIDVSKWKNVAAYLGRVAERPAVQAALKAEGLVK
jgi:glutathione S-transferase